MSVSERRRLIAVVAAIVGLPILLGVLSWWSLRPATPVPAPPTPSPTSQGPTPAPTTSAPTPIPTPSPVQQTLLFQVRWADAGAVDNAVLASGGSINRATFVYAPPGLVLDGGAEGPTTLADTVLSGDTLAPVRAMSNLTGVRIDGSLALDRLAFAGLIDAVGGVPVDVRQVIIVAEPDGTFVTTIPVGARTLDGVTASYYAMTRMPGEPESARMARFADVLVKTVSALPADPDRLRQLITSLGALARSTIPADQLIAILQSMRAELNAGDVTQARLPVAVVPPRTSTTFSFKPVAGAALMGELLPDAVIPKGEGDQIRVLVRPIPRAREQLGAARDLLVSDGYAYVDGGTEVRVLPGQRRTLIRIPSDTEEWRQRGEDIATALGIAATATVTVSPFPELVDVSVVLGADFARKASVRG